MVDTKNLSLKLFFYVSKIITISEKAEVEEVVAKILNLNLLFPVSIIAAFSEKVKAEGS